MIGALAIWSTVLGAAAMCCRCIRNPSSHGGTLHGIGSIGCGRLSAASTWPSSEARHTRWQDSRTYGSLATGRGRGGLLTL
ncbi:hypothetical protein F5X96DRAFT_615507 [Biscogniauxia mediterranea]|nr:hypothetical protein F5X96DRAFT_615507 [Biscogniauxia mediterranea]